MGVVDKDFGIKCLGVINIPMLLKLNYTILESILKLIYGIAYYHITTLFKDQEYTLKIINQLKKI